MSKSILQWLLFILVAFVLAISLRVFIFDTYTIPTPSMEPAIMSGDHVVVNKLIPGPRIIKNFFSLGKGEKPIFKRLRGFGVKRNDVLIFNFPYSDWERLDLDMNVYYAKRCVAIPGDTFYIEDGIYKVKGLPDTLGCLKNQQALSGKKNKEFDFHIFHCYPYNGYYNWNIKNFGPLYVPAQGDNITIDTLNAILYKNLISYETTKHIKIKDGTVMLGDSIIREYTFMKNYYFMAGDYVFDSKDSRYWGLLPEDHIAGKVAFIWNNTDVNTKKKSWGRFLKPVE
ncbi:signal peptidase I [Dysgonomonas reticulitermitis]